MSDSVAALRKALEEFRQKLDDAIGDLDDDLNELQDRLKVAEGLEAKLEAVAKIASGP